MDGNDEIDRELGDLEPSRRQFIRRISAGVVAAPVIATLSMSALSASPAYAASNTS